MKKFLAVILCALMVIPVLAGCGQQASTQTTGTTSADTAATASTAAGSTQEAEKNVTIAGAFMCSDQQQKWLDMFEEYHKLHPNVTIDMTPMPGQPDEYLQPKAAANDLPDIFTIGGNAFGAKLADGGYLKDLRDTKVWNNLVDGVKTSFTSPKGIGFGVTYGIATSYIWYREDDFKAAGITKDPENWDEFISDLDKLKSATGRAPIILSGDGTFGNTIFAWAIANNVIPKLPDWRTKFQNGEYDFNNPDIIDAFQKGVQLAKYAQKGVVSTNWVDSQQLYISGTIGSSIFAGSWCAGTLLPKDAKFATKIIVPPFNKPGEKLIPVVGAEQGIGIYNKSKNDTETTALLEWMFGDGYPLFQNPKGNVPPLKNYDQSKVVLADVVKNTLPALTASPQAGGMYYEILPIEIKNLVPKLWQEVLNGDKTPEQAAQAMEDLNKSLFKK